MNYNFYNNYNYTPNFQPGTISISGSTINSAGAQIGNPVNSSSQGTQVSISDSTITDIQGSNPSGSAILLITGFASTAGSPGVGISANTSITTDSGQIEINGTGLLAAGSDATGVSISASDITCGTAGVPGTGQISIEGNSDSGATQLAPNSTFANNSYGVQILGSTLSSYSTSSMKIKGIAHAANNLDSIGVDLNSSGNDTLIQTFNAENEINGNVQSETFSASSGEANEVVGVRTMSTDLEANGSNASISIDTDTHDVTASDNGDTSVQVKNVGAYFLDNTTISASGSNVVLSSPILISGRSGTAVASTGNSSETESDGVWLSGGDDGGPVTVTNTGLGSTLLTGEAGSATGEVVADLGVTLGNSSGTAISVTAPGGGSIGLAGLGGTVSAGSNSTFSGLAEGVFMEYSTVTATTGDIAVLAAGASTSGSVPAGSTVTIAGLGLASSTLQTNTTTAGANQIPNGGSVPPLILIYATNSTLLSNPTSFQLGSATGYAVSEDANSKLVTGELVMGDYYDLLKAYGTASAIATAAKDLATYDNDVLNPAGFSLKGHTITGFTFNPPGIISLTSTQNQITNLSAAFDGTGGFSLDDSVNLTVGAIGETTNANYGEINEAGVGPVTITMASGMNLTLSGVSPFTNASTGVPVIATTGLGNTVTLTTTGTGQLINTAGATALSVAGGANYILYAASPTNVTLDGIASTQTLYNTLSPGAAGSTANTIAFASMAPVTPSNDILDGTAYTDSGLTIAGGTTIDLVFDGVLLGSTTTSNTGAFSFTIGPSGVGVTADLNSGVLLTDPADRGNTFYQATSPLATITGVDIWGSTLRVMADTARNFALGQVAGSLANAGINYTVSGSNLSTNAGVNVLILPNSAYTLDGNIIAGGTLTTGANAPLASSGTGAVTLTGTSIALGASLTSAGTVNFATANTGTLTQGAITDASPVQVGGFVLESGTWSQVVGQAGLTALPAFNAAGNFELQGASTFVRATGIDSANGNAYETADVYGLQGLASPSGALLGANAELVGNIDATGTASWNGGAGFVPIGNSSTSAYGGVFNGQGNTINGLTINTSSLSMNTGLFGKTGGESTIENVGVTNVLISGGYEVGGLVGNNTGTIKNASVTGAVAGISESDNAGGLVGLNDGSITNAHSSTAVVGSEGTDIGGLVGFSDGPISTVYSTGSVTGNGSVDVGGLVGDLRSTLNIGYSSGAVSDAGSSYLNLGGLVGYTYNATITNSFSIGSVTTSSGGESIYVGGLVGYVGGTISNTYSAGPVVSTGGASFVGGFAGYNGGTISNSFWDTDPAGTVVSGVGSDETPNTTPGVTASTTADLQSESYILAHSPTQPTFDFTETWTTDGGMYTPQLVGLPIAGLVPSIPGSSIMLTVDPSKEVNDALYSIVPIQTLEGILDPGIIGGAGGVAGDKDRRSLQALEAHLAARYGRARAGELLAIIEQDQKDGSTVNTGTLATKWAANTGLSKLLWVGEASEISQGSAQPQVNSPLIFDLFQQQSASAVRNELSQAATGTGAKGNHGH